MFELDGVFSIDVIAKVAKYENVPEIQQPLTAIKSLNIDITDSVSLPIANNSKLHSQTQCNKYAIDSKLSRNSNIVEMKHETTVQEILDTGAIHLLNDDVNWLHQLLSGCNSREKKILLSQYEVLWIETMNKTVSNIKKQNHGRHVANTWIREHIESINMLKV